ncbi:hypothetical protein FRC12_016623 [Ceratobasidium sp. 428]|nr:hypothetical protein FRC12_016623 [Ceratobasidium sp. 428]
MDDFAGFFDDKDVYDYPNDEVPAEWDTEPEPNIVPNPDVQGAATNEIAEYEAVKAVVACIDQRGLKLDTFLDALLWGNGKCVSDLGLRDTRRELTRSSRLPAILDHLHTPITQQKVLG